MTNMKDKIATWYTNNIWTKTQVANAVVKKVITDKDYKEITGEKYKAVTKSE